MLTYALLLNPGHNRVYYKSSQNLSQVEFSIIAQNLTCMASNISGQEIEGVFYLTFDAQQTLSHSDLEKISRLSFVFALFEKQGDMLRPIMIPQANIVDARLGSLLKYTGKTNELFTRMMINVALASCDFAEPERVKLLDPIAGKGTTLFEGLTMGFDSYGVEIMEKSANEAYHHLKKFLEIERVKHKPDIIKRNNPQKDLASKHFVIDFAQDKDAFKHHQELHFEMVAGNSSYCDRYFKKESFHILVGDLPYGVQHGNMTSKKTQGSSLTRSPQALVKACAPAWKKVLVPGGVLALSWNSNVFSKAEFACLLAAQGFTVLNDDAYGEFEHRVDSAIMRDLIIARKPR